MSNRTIVAILAVLGLLALVVAVQPVFACTEGCTPGYWKNRTDSWLETPWNTDTTIAEACGDICDMYHSAKLCYEYDDHPDYTVSKAVQSTGGGWNAPFRHAAASILNSGHPDVSFADNPCDICGQISAGLTAEDPEFNKDILEE